VPLANDVKYFSCMVSPPIMYDSTVEQTTHWTGLTAVVAALPATSAILSVAEGDVDCAWAEKDKKMRKKKNNSVAERPSPLPLSQGATLCTQLFKCSV
jgi:hypothetical protein